MTEHGTTNRLHTDSDQEPGTITAIESSQEPVQTDLIFAFSGGEKLDLYGLSLLLTARQMAHEDDRSVWVAGLSRHSWMLLKALGLEDLFLPFPRTGRLDS